RVNLLSVHDDDLRKWALQKARELELTRFSASHNWIQNFKRCYRMTSRKVTKFTTHKRERDQEEIENAAAELILDFVDTVRPNYDPPQIFNTDQSGFNYLVYSNRTQSHTGEKKTLVAIQAMNALTHSYTIQPTLNMDGRLVGRLFVNLQEPGGGFGPIVATEVTRYPNLFVTCTKSGKLDKGLMRTWCQTIFKEILDRTHTDDCVLYLDSWGGQKDSSLFELDGKRIKIKTLPPGSTSLIQPLDQCFPRVFPNDPHLDSTKTPWPTTKPSTFEKEHVFGNTL
ncbi:tigger transposable element-derived protein 2-like, partial [Galendromus occidentalis]|uniref:Tigger transposable element-derived protein 2-like n=1 Tax=Galendromus occidentalis TaxID=34638 RepID=A0AAJ7L6K5_9ACAR